MKASLLLLILGFILLAPQLPKALAIGVALAFFVISLLIQVGFWK